MPPGLLYFSIRIKINADELGTCKCSLLWVWFLEFLDFPARSVEGSKSKWKLIRWQVHLIWSEHTSIWSQLSGIIYRLHIRRCVFVARTPPLEAIKSIVTWLPALSSHRVLVQDGTNCAEDASASGISPPPAAGFFSLDPLHRVYSVWYNWIRGKSGLQHRGSQSSAHAPGSPRWQQTAHCRLSLWVRLQLHQYHL